MSAPFIKIVPPIREYSLVCRGCLAESGEMKNIREWGMIDDFYRVTNIQMRHSDGISELLCGSCEEALLMCLKFRNQCQQSDITLKNIVQNQNCESIDESTQNTITWTLSDISLTYNITAPNMDQKIYLPCPYNCMDACYIKKKDLLLHLVKKHEKYKKIVIETKYFCNIEQCAYHFNGSKCFSERKFLNQHFNKVHKSKDIHCDSCQSNFATVTEFNRHLKTCNVVYNCDICNIQYKTNERLLVHLMRHHPVLHEDYKNAKKAAKRKSKSDTEAKKVKTDAVNEYLMDSPKRSFATQTLDPIDSIKNDVALPSWQTPLKTDEISTQTVFEDLLSLKSQNSEDESIFFSETVALSDIQTQTFPEFGLSRSNKETITENQIDLSIKGTQTCFCYCDLPKSSYTGRLIESVSSSPGSNNFTSTETQTAEFKFTIKSDVMLGFSSAETQTCFDEDSASL